MCIFHFSLLKKNLLFIRYSKLTLADRNVLLNIPAPSELEITGYDEEEGFDETVWTEMDWKKFSKFSRKHHCRVFFGFGDE